MLRLWVIVGAHQCIGVEPRLGVLLGPVGDGLCTLGSVQRKCHLQHIERRAGRGVLALECREEFVEIVGACHDDVGAQLACFYAFTPHFENPTHDLGVEMGGSSNVNMFFCDAMVLSPSLRQVIVHERYHLDRGCYPHAGLCVHGELALPFVAAQHVLVVFLTDGLDDSSEHAAILAHGSGRQSKAGSVTSGVALGCMAPTEPPACWISSKFSRAWNLSWGTFFWWY